MKRNNLDICADILRVSRGGAKKTHIVYRANLNFKIVKGYLTRLAREGSWTVMFTGVRVIGTPQIQNFVVKFDYII